MRLLHLPVVAMLAAFVSTSAAQTRTIRVMGNDGLPVPYAAVWLDRARPRIADAAGIVTVPENVKGAITVDVARLGYQPVQTPIEIPELSAEFTVTLPRLRIALQPMQIVERANPSVLEQTGFYRRALEQQRTSSGAVFFTPEELDAFEVLTELPDPDLYNWISGEKPLPKEQDTPMFHRVRDYHSQGFNLDGHR